MQPRWKTDITHLMTTYRDALAAMVPFVERVRIPWRPGASYDDWDAIATVLFTQIVERSILAGLPQEAGSAKSIHPYDVLESNYSHQPFVRVIQNEQAANETLAFHSFGTDREPFDVVNAVALNQSFLRESEPTNAGNAAGARFSVIIPAHPDPIEVFDVEVEV